MKHPAAGILTPLCALCGDEEGRCHGEAEEDMPGSFQTGAHSGTSWRNQSFASRALLPALDGRWRGYTVPRRASLERRSKPVYCSHLRRPIGLRMAGRVVGWELVAYAGSRTLSRFRRGWGGPLRSLQGPSDRASISLACHRQQLRGVGRQPTEKNLHRGGLSGVGGPLAQCLAGT